MCRTPAAEALPTLSDALVCCPFSDDSDFDALFGQMRDPESVRMAAFTAENPDDRTAFDVHMAKVRTLPEVPTRAVTVDGRLVGSIASFVVDGDTEVTYWIDRSFWGQGIAGRALALLLESVRVRPLFARAQVTM